MIGAIGELITCVQQGGSALVQVVSVVTAGSKVYEVAGTAIDSLRGFIGPRQEENIRKIGKIAREKLATVDPGRLSEPSPSVATPLLEAACQEGREELQELWACLLANAMLDGSRGVRRDYFEAVRQMEPLDVLLLQSYQVEPSRASTFRSNFKQEAASLGFSEDDATVAAENLAKLRVTVTLRGGAAVVGDPLSSFGRALLTACTVK